ncbi:MAG: hypothetical protein KJ558_08130 [Gammaproteobacteria bacterium]|nr:hypothetical protein [Gammaproteobacteria bacterium]MBU1654780.1 hypothetical protein [Gammaproteobacteria bacterium]MBU1962653.1 hypothetical protein [Gammaproteobacteria bacterium]
MDSLLIRWHHSRNVLIRLVLLTVVASALIAMNIEFVNEVYFRNQITRTGYIINGGIVLLFLLGMVRIITALLVYVGEESQLARFVANLDAGGEDGPLKEMNKRSLIAIRYATLEKLHQARTPINQSVLASTLVASESTRTSLIRFINNILILTGVFGTIVSLSLALLGASDMLESSVNVSGMGLVIHGMSTALSTTITAIVCYLFIGYFHLKLNDVQTNLVSGIEQITSTHLIPRFQVQTETVLYEFTGLLRSLQGLVRQMEISQDGIANLEKRLTSAIEAHAERTDQFSAEVRTIKHLLKDGFRLTEDA